MGIELAIASLAVGLASAGLEYDQSRKAASASKKVENERTAASRRQAAGLAESQAANDATATARMARLRQRAYLSGNQDQTVATSPMGLAQTQSGGATGPQPLKKLGA